MFEVTFNEVPNLFGKLSWWQRLSYTTIGTYYLVGATQFIFTLIPFLFFFTGILPASMEFSEFVVYGVPVMLCAIIIYLYVQRWMCDPGTERGLHLRGMVLKFACWPVYFMGFLLALVDADIPYIPTAKKAVTGYITPFVRPLVVHIFAFVVAVAGVVIYRRYYMPESQLSLSAERTWGMIGFAFLAFIMATGGVYAALEARKMKVEAPWDKININEINGRV